MSKILKEDAIILFKPCKNISQLKDLIKSNFHLWYDENSTIKMLDICHKDAVKTKSCKHFGTMLFDDNSCYILEFVIHPNKSVNIVI